MPSTQVKYAQLGAVKVFYREAGTPKNPVMLLLHGFPSSSHQYRNLIPLLEKKYHVLAPDLPGFGFTEVAAEADFKYTFANFAQVIADFLDLLSITKFAMYIFDYGAPTGLRLALQRPQAVTAIVSQNGNGYVEGLGAAWDPIRKYWSSASIADRDALHSILNFETTKFQYTHGSRFPERIAPESYFLDHALISRPGNPDIQLDLFYDYRTNVDMYPAFQDYFRSSKVPLLAVWGKNDPFFIPPGAQAFKRDLPDAEVHLLDAGHFAVETETEEIADLMLKFLEKKGI
jgi:pimeloyl-ACP methyl ester carboxylesterase